MIVSSSCIGMDSARIYNSVRMDAATYSRGVVNKFPDFLSNKDSLLKGDTNTKAQEDDSQDEETSVADSLSDTLADIRSRYDFLKVNQTLPSKIEQDSISRIKSQCLQYLLRMLLGHRGKADIDENFWNNYSYSANDADVSFSKGITTITETLNHSHYFSESEDTTFNTTGTVLTADGRSIDFNLELSMSRSFTEYYEENISRDIVLCDPLVINLGTNVAEVSDVKFRFDLDCDGADDSVSTLSSNSGFLALDLNEDGVINDGSELFGTKSGNGFYDLSAYDEDGNGWIDEADSIFNKLKILTVADDGSQTLLSLKGQDIGAIYLGNVSTDFSLNSTHDNHTNAMIRSTGIFLYENGTVGSIQQVDLAKSEYTA